MLCNTNVIQQIATSREVEAVDLLVRFQDALTLIQNDDDAHDEIEKLRLQIDTLIQTLPADLRTSIEH
jgi:hypothetical protein